MATAGSGSRLRDARLGLPAPSAAQLLAQLPAAAAPVPRGLKARGMRFLRGLWEAVPCKMLSLSNSQ